MQVKKLIVQKSRTLRKSSGYAKTEYCLEAELTEKDDVQSVRDYLLLLIEGWLNEK